MREMISSMMRFSGAVAMFGIEQVQNAVAAPADTRAAIVKMRETLDMMSESLVSKLDEPKQAALESMSKAQSEIVDRSLDAVNLNAAENLMKKTSDSLSDAMNRSGASATAGAA
jgi:hypothetical protein